jgi:hypothetical protein
MADCRNLHDDPKVRAVSYRETAAEVRESASSAPVDCPRSSQRGLLELRNSRRAEEKSGLISLPDLWLRLVGCIGLRSLDLLREHPA